MSKVTGMPDLPSVSPQKELSDRLISLSATNPDSVLIAVFSDDYTEKDWSKGDRSGTIITQEQCDVMLPGARHPKELTLNHRELRDTLTRGVYKLDVGKSVYVGNFNRLTLGNTQWVKL